MNIKKLALVFCVLFSATNCAVKNNSFTQTQKLKQADKVINSENKTATIKIDGSSTAYPITQLIANKFQSSSAYPAQIQVKISGTTAGFTKFCAGETDINNASRPILSLEMEACKKNGIVYMELPIAFDALTIAVNPQNNWAKDITVAELKKIWEPSAQGKITRWNQVRASWPDRPLNLYGADKKSGTFDYFTQAAVGKIRASRSDYIANEDDEVLVDSISKDPNALGYFGYAYYEKYINKLKALAVDRGKGAVFPSVQNVKQGEYQPFSRPLFIYINPRFSGSKIVLYKFIDFYIAKVPEVINTVKYIPLSEECYHLNYIHFYKGKVGTVFQGKTATNLTIPDLLKKEARF
jgi:phosphate transport system substrate-binding protein